MKQFTALRPDPIGIGAEILDVEDAMRLPRRRHRLTVSPKGFNSRKRNVIHRFS
jgi:hypothetical protein